MATGKIWLFLLLGAIATLASTPCAAEPDWGERLAALQSALSAEAQGDSPPTVGQREAIAGLLGRAETAIERVAAAATVESAAAKQLPALRATAASDLAADLREWRRRLPAKPSSAWLETALHTEQAGLAELGATLAAARNELLASEAAPFSGERLAELQLQWDALQRSDQAALASAAERLRQRAERLAVEAEIAAIDAERRVVEPRRQLARARLEATQVRIALAEQRLAMIQPLLAGSEQRRVAAWLEELETQAATVAAYPALALASEDTLRLARELAAGTSTLIELRERTRAAQLAREATAATLAAVQSRLGIDADGGGLGSLLLAERRRLANPERLRKQLDGVRATIAVARLRLLELPREAELPRSLLRQDSEADDEALAEGDTSALLRGESALRESRARLIDALGDTLQRQLDALSQYEVALRRQLQDVRLLRDLLDRQLLWLPTHDMVSAAWVQRLQASATDVADPSRWVTALRLLGQRVLSQPWPLLLGLACTLCLLLARPWLRRRLHAEAPSLRRVADDRYLFTLRCLGLTLLHSLPWPLLIAVLGGQWARAGEPGKFSHSLGVTLGGLALSVWLFSLLRILVIERGLAHLHFRWTRPRRESVYRQLLPAALLLIPLQFVVALAFTRGQEPAIDGLARCGALLFALVAATLTWRGLAPGAWWTPRGRSEPFRLRAFLRVLLPSLFAGLALLLLSGYVYSASVLLRCLWMSLWTALLVAIVHGMLARWFLLGERRLARERLLAQRAVQGGSDDEAADSSDEIVSLEAVNTQTSRLLRATTLSLWVVGLLWVWSDVYPALDRLDGVILWQVSDVDAGGDAVRQAVTLKDLLIGVFALALTWVAARNLPGLLEIGLLSRFRVDAPSRYAIASLSRYVIVIAGSLVGLGLLGLRWSQLQWMAAALTVGLGFGLQEIFANFVSGLILLFERPFRVGDVITIGEFTGTVSRIRTRATTIVDFDNKEVVIPNKAFITDRLINWTLSDTRTRIVLRVGVAYGSDIALVHRLLQQAAQEQPAVLAEPAAVSWLMAFGGSTLDFELRVFVEQLSQRLPTTNALHMRIVELFAAHGVEIAFPQLDLHVRHLPDAGNGDRGMRPGDAEGALTR